MVQGLGVYELQSIFPSVVKGYGSLLGNISETNTLPEGFLCPPYWSLGIKLVLTVAHAMQVV